MQDNIPTTAKGWEAKTLGYVFFIIMTIDPSLDSLVHKRAKSVGTSGSGIGGNHGSLDNSFSLIGAEREATLGR